MAPMTSPALAPSAMGTASQIPCVEEEGSQSLTAAPTTAPTRYPKPNPGKTWDFRPRGTSSRVTEANGQLLMGLLLRLGSPGNTSASPRNASTVVSNLRRPQPSAVTRTRSPGWTGGGSCPDRTAQGGRLPAPYAERRGSEGAVLQSKAPSAAIAVSYFTSARPLPQLVVQTRPVRYGAGLVQSGCALTSPLRRLAALGALACGQVYRVASYPVALMN
jgi:hypothetical protein